MGYLQSMFLSRNKQTRRIFHLKVFIFGGKILSIFEQACFRNVNCYVTRLHQHIVNWTSNVRTSMVMCYGIQIFITKTRIQMQSTLVIVNSKGLSEIL